MHSVSLDTLREALVVWALCNPEEVMIYGATIESYARRAVRDPGAEEWRKEVASAVLRGRMNTAAARAAIAAYEALRESDHERAVRT